MAARSAMLCGVVKDAVGSPLTQLGASIEEFVCVFDDGMTDAVLAQLPTPSVVRDANQLLLDEEAQPVAPLAAPLALPVKPLYTGITAINLNGCHNVTDAGLLTISRLCPKLARLEVYWNTSISDEGIAALCRAECGANLETLNLSGCQTLTDGGVTALAAGCAVLEWLSLHGNNKVTMAGLKALMAAPCAATIHSLDVRGCVHLKEVLDDDFKGLRTAFPKCTTFVLHT
eukprot:Selendium_serpulae@DN3473_c0_g1_i2.p1